jgi:hypothetical protein
MRSLIGIFVVAALGVAVHGQTGSAGPKVIAEISASSEKIVKGSPFSADAVSESVQVLVDGNRITRSSTSKLYRNSEGRFRRESSIGSAAGTVFGFGTYSDLSPSTLILDPVSGYRYYLNENSKTVRALSLKPTLAPGQYKTAVAAGAAQAEKVRAELKAAGVAVATPGSAQVVLAPVPPVPGAPALPPTPPTAAARALIATGSAWSGGEAFAFGFASGGGNAKTEELGTRDFDGVQAEGTRTTTTIEAGAIGNEKPIEIIYEKWYSKDLQLVVESRHYDPRFGEQTYKLTNINRTEPDPSLFNLPSEYRLLTEPTTVYRTVAPKAIVERTAPTRVITLTPSTKP